MNAYGLAASPDTNIVLSLHFVVTLLNPKKSIWFEKVYTQAQGGFRFA